MIHPQIIMLLLPLQTLGCRPIASLDHFLPEMLGSADLVEEVQVGEHKIVKVRIILLSSYGCIYF